MSSMIIVAIIIGGIAGALVTFAMTSGEKTQEQLIADHYTTETAVLVSPHGLRGHIAKGDDTFVIVDVRSEEEYIEEHIVGALNVPAYSDRYTSAYGQVDRIVDEFTKIRADNPGKDIIVYCYSMPCMTGRKVGKMLADHDIYVQELGIGWNEWRYFWTLWNHPHEWNTTFVEDYVVSGPEPGEFKGLDEGAACPIEGDFGC